MKKLDEEQIEAILDLFPHGSVIHQLTEIGLIEPKLELNKWYQFKDCNFIIFAEGVNSFNEVLGYGFNEGDFEDLTAGPWCDASECEPVTQSEVFKAFRKVAEDEKYHYTEIWMNENVLYTNNGIIFKDGKWLPKQVTIKGINYLEIK